MDPATGLSSAEAERRLREEGRNALPSRERRGMLALVGGVLREPMFLLLIGAASIYLALGDLREALVLAASILVVVGITVVQERRTERALEALRDLSSPRALVVRDGHEARIAGIDVVRGDLLLLREGDRVPADARLLEAHALQIDESLLTGESLPCEKAVGEGAAGQVYSGTLVVKGQGRGEVTATGPRSELGRIGMRLTTVEPVKTSLEIETGLIVRRIAVVGLALCLVVAALFAATRGDVLGGVLAGVTLAMAVLPEEFPVVLTVFLALGAWRIARRGVLTRSLPAIEMLGAATVLCCDKTGTLTENRMKVVEIWRGDGWRAPRSGDPLDAALLEAAALACEPHPFDPMERAILAADEAAGGAGAKWRAEGALEQRHPAGDEFLAVAHGWRLAAAEARIAMKGAPETVLALCRMEEAERAQALAAIGAAASRGLRLLGVAQAPWGTGDWPASPAQHAFRFDGFVALADPLRAPVPAALERCRRAGVRIVMITGDHLETARAIARQAGIDAAEALTGDDVEALGDEALAPATRRVSVFARVRPEQKLRLVKGLAAAGEIVAMTGDGVNDAPALKAAHIGVAMGQRGTDVAREAASLVLLDDDFTSIVATIQLGRRIYDNIRNAMRYLVAVHVPLAGMSLLPLALGWPLFVFPVHVVFLEFVIDPACSIVFEAERSDPRSMERPPRPSGERLFDAASLVLAFLLGASVLAVVAAVFGVSLRLGHGEDLARALAFTTLVAGNLALIAANRSPTRTTFAMLGRTNRALAWIVGATLAALGAVLYVPAAAEVFRFAPPPPVALVIALAAGLVSVLWYDLAKALRRD